jgi:hypothetical protein
MKRRGPWDEDAMWTPEQDQEWDNLHRCKSCGVTGGGVEKRLCEACRLSERQR